MKIIREIITISIYFISASKLYNIDRFTEREEKIDFTNQVVTSFELRYF